MSASKWIDTCFIGDVRDGLRQFIADGVKVQTVCTSPPYFGLRDYGTAQWDGGDPACDHMAPPRGGKDPATSSKQLTSAGTLTYQFTDACGKCGARRVDRQIGLESTPAAYVQTMVEVFRLVRDVLADDGTLWLNIGDSYIGSWGNSGSRPELDGKTQNQRPKDAEYLPRGGWDERRDRPPGSFKIPGLKPKDLAGIPWRLAFALQSDGWVLRSEIIWEKPNPMPESVTDRPTKAHEQVFLFSKAKWIGPPRGQFAHISDDDARWLAAMIDTEGCIVIKRCQHAGRADTFAPQVTFGSTSRALIDRVAELAGHGNVLERKGLNAPMFYWQLANGVARDFLYRIYPFLIVKRRQARIGIHVDSLTYCRGGQKPERKQRTAAEHDALVSLWARNKECNKFGNPDLSDVPDPVYGRWDSQPYYYDAAAIAEQATKPVGSNGNFGNKDATARRVGELTGNMAPGVEYLTKESRNRRTVWTIATEPYAEAHFATFPTALVEPCILAGSRVGDGVLDPFMGSGTVAQVAQSLGRRWIGCELNPAYVEMQRKRAAQRGLELVA